jgi:hypothetical protein
LDPKRVFETAMRWVRGVLLTPDATVAEYRALDAPWQRTVGEVTAPVIGSAYLIGVLLSLVTGSDAAFGAGGGSPFWMLVSLAWAIGVAFVAAFVFDAFAGNFGGQRSFDRAFAMVSLAMIPGALGGILSAVPWIGWILSLAASVYGLVLLYRFVPTFLAVPEASRVAHFAISIVVCIVVNLVVAVVLGGAAATSQLARG